jgi:hypothetical protein
MFGGAVQTSLPIAESHNHLVLSIIVPVSMLSTRLAAVELAMPMMIMSFIQACDINHVITKAMGQY